MGLLGSRGVTDGIKGKAARRSSKVSRGTREKAEHSQGQALNTASLGRPVRTGAINLTLLAVSSSVKISLLLSSGPLLTALPPLPSSEAPSSSDF